LILGEYDDNEPGRKLTAQGRGWVYITEGGWCGRHSLTSFLCLSKLVQKYRFLAQFREAGKRRRPGL